VMRTVARAIGWSSASHRWLNAVTASNRRKPGLAAAVVGRKPAALAALQQRAVEIVDVGLEQAIDIDVQAVAGGQDGLRERCLQLARPG
jgi:hypothetical protein